jgi:hypothetical protein
MRQHETVRRQVAIRNERARGMHVASSRDELRLVDILRD